MFASSNKIDLNQIEIMEQTIEIQNLKCGGCEKTTKNKLKLLEGVSNVTVNIENGTVSFTQESDEVFLNFKKTLTKLGYPLVADKNSLGKIAKSYISCAQGRMEN